MPARHRLPKGERVLKRDGAAIVPFGLSLAWGLVGAVGAYAVVRSIQFAVYPDPNPAGVVWSAHAGYFWRAWTVGYAGGIAAFVVLPVAQRHVEGCARALGPAVGVAAALLALQAALFP
jgi:hypothetical protein